MPDDRDGASFGRRDLSTDLRARPPPLSPVMGLARAPVWPGARDGVRHSCCAGGSSRDGDREAGSFGEGASMGTSGLQRVSTRSRGYASGEC
jgi:hypothetical protein